MCLVEEANEQRKKIVRLQRDIDKQNRFMREVLATTTEIRELPTTEVTDGQETS